MNFVDGKGDLFYNRFILKKGWKLTVIKKAIAFATKAHEGQMRKGTTRPFITHPLEVAQIVSTMTEDKEVICAAILHDTIEDCEGITKEILEAEVPYTRVLAFNEKGREILKEAKKQTAFLNAGERTEAPYWQLEQRCGSLYGLFCVDAPEAPDAETTQRIYYQK